MATVMCPHCKQEKEARGFTLHEKACKIKNDPWRKRYAKDIAHMTPENAEKFLRKAQGL